MEVDGQRAGSHRYVYEGYLFHKDPRYQEYRRRFTCSERKTHGIRCKVKLWVYGGVRFHQDGEHGHDPPTIDQRERIIRNLREEATTHRDILPNAIVQRVFRQDADYPDIDMTMETARRHVHSERRLLQPPLPRYFEEIGRDVLEIYEPLQNLYQGAIRGDDDDSMAYLFATPEMLLRLNEAHELHLDATYGILPAIPGATQVLVIYMRKMDIGIPVLYAVCKRRTVQLYRQVWRFLLRSAPGLYDNLRIIVSDFEAAIISSVRLELNWVTINGCWFHFIRAVSRKWTALRLPFRENDLVLREAWTLPLMPARLFRNGINVIAETAQRYEEEYPQIILFIRYLINYWLPLSNVASVWNTPWRTNNIAEAFNRQLSARFGEHPSFFTFLHRLIDQTNDSEMLFRQIANGHLPNRAQRRSQRRKDLHIRDLQHNLLTQRFTVKEFISCAVNRNQHQQITLTLAEEHRNDIYDEYEEAHLQDLLPADNPAPRLNICRHCFAGVTEVAYSDCGHKCICINCHIIENRQNLNRRHICPVCFQPSTSLFRVIIS